MSPMPKSVRDEAFDQAADIIRRDLVKLLPDRIEAVDMALDGTGIHWAMAVVGGTIAALATVIHAAGIDRDKHEMIAAAMSEGFLTNLAEIGGRQVEGADDA